MKWIAAIAFVALIPSYAPAAEDEEASWELPPEVPRPDFIARKPFVPDLLLKDKRDGWYFTGIPAVGWDDEEGVILGGFLQIYDNGPRDGPFFRSTPYRKQILLGATVTTEDVQDYAIGVDLPYIAGSPYRIRAALALERNPLNNYFGKGDDAMRGLRFPGSDGVFDDFDDFDDALQQAVDGQAYTRYVQWKSESVGGAVVLERDLLGGIVRPLIGFGAQYMDVTDYSGRRVDAVDENGKKIRAEQLPTKLREDSDAGIITGIDGGWDSRVQLGISLDTRDFEPDPSEGVLAQLSGEASTRLLGSDYDYQRVTLSVAGYRSLIPRRTRLILGLRGMYSMQFGDVPFYQLRTYSLNTLNIQGLGGFRTMRGFKRNRFVGESGVLLNADLRWTLGEGTYFGQHFRPMVATFVDLGRVFDDVDFDFEGWEPSYGAGFRFAWNLATMVSFDYGISHEGSVFYMSFGHQF